MAGICALSGESIRWISPMDYTLPIISLIPLMIVVTLFTGSAVAQTTESNWEYYKSLKLGTEDGALEGSENSNKSATSFEVLAPQNSLVLDKVQAAPSKVQPRPVREKGDYGSQPARSFSTTSCTDIDGTSCYEKARSAVVCPTERTKGNSRWSWFLCNLDVDSIPYLSPYGIDMPMSFMTPGDGQFTHETPARIMVYMHPDEGGSGSFVTGSSSFSYRSDAVEIHSQEEHYKENPGGSWWGFSGGQVNRVANYNGRRIAASIDYVLSVYGDKIDIEKGIYLVGKSLGGSGVMHQSMILPKYQKKIAVVNSVIGTMNFPKCCQETVSKAWGVDHFDNADFRLQYKKISDIHFHWQGGSDDKLGRFDIEFYELCEQYKISCSGVWLQSGHGVREAGYSIETALFLDENQDVTLDKILPVITGSTANHHGTLRGYHNRGITWNYARIIDSVDRIEIPLKYLAGVNYGAELPDQPAIVSFDVTPRHVARFPIVSGETLAWRFGLQSGQVVVGADGTLTIDKLKLKTGANYQNLVIRHMSE